MPQKRRKSPQEKKKLSYSKDRRNTYGENDKASRRIIPLRKKLRNRAERKAGQHFLAENPDMAEAQFQQKRRRAWKKASDEALGAVVSKRMNARKERFDAKRKRRMATQEFGKKLNDSDV